jgi:5'-nucleotidase
VIAASMMLNGKPVDPAVSYRVTVNDFLAAGGDGFTVLKQGSRPQFGIYDAEALFAYFQANEPITPPATDRVVKTD